MARYGGLGALAAGMNTRVGLQACFLLKGYLNESLPVHAQGICVFLASFSPEVNCRSVQKRYFVGVTNNEKPGSDRTLPNRILFFIMSSPTASVSALLSHVIFSQHISKKKTRGDSPPLDRHVYILREAGKSADERERMRLPYPTWLTSDHHHPHNDYASILPSCHLTYLLPPHPTQ